MRYDLLDDWIVMKEMNRLTKLPAERLQEPLRAQGQEPMDKLVNQPNVNRIARDLSIGLVIAGAVVLFFL